MDTVKHNMGWIEVIVGPMFSGKSEELIRRLRRAEFARQRVQIFKPTIDERYSATEIVSHSGLGIRSTNVSKASEIIEKIDPRTEVIGGRPFRISTARFATAGSVYEAQVAVSLDEILGVMKDFRHLLLLMIPGVLLVACAGAKYPSAQQNAATNAFDASLAKPMRMTFMVSYSFPRQRCGKSSPMSRMRAIQYIIY